MLLFKEGWGGENIKMVGRFLSMTEVLKKTSRGEMQRRLFQEEIRESPRASQFDGDILHNEKERRNNLEGLM